MNRPRPTLPSILAVAALLGLAALPGLLAGQRSPDGLVPTYDAVLTIQRDGTLAVRETFTFDYAGVEKRGLLRRLPYRRGDRLYEIHGFHAASTTHAPVDVRRRTFMHQAQFRVGSGRKVSGRHAYVLTYDVRGAVSPGADHDELLWDVLGPAWPAPIEEAAVRVEAPAPFGSGCLAGHADAYTPCARERHGPLAMNFTQTDLRAGEGITIRAAFPKGVIAAPAPRRAAAHTAWSSTALSVLLGAAVAALALCRARPAVPALVRRTVLAAGTALLLADALAETVPAGIWNLSLGDPALYGLALVLPALALAERPRPVR